jgi:hypothetical protein
VAAHRYRSTYNGITFNGIYPPGWDPAAPTDQAQFVSSFAESDYRLDSLDFTSLSTQDLREIKQFMDGAEPNEIFEGIRTIVGRGKILAASPADLEDKSWALHRAFSPMEVRRVSKQSIVGTNPDEPAGVLPYNFSRDHAPTRLNLRFYARPNIGRPLAIGRRAEGLTRDFAFQLVAYDPRAYSQALVTRVFTNHSGGNNTVAYLGNTYSYPQVRIVMSGNGAATHTLRNDTSGNQMTFDLSGLGAGTIWLRMARGEADNGSGTSRYYLRKSGFLTNMFLVPGNNQWQFSPATNVTSVTLYYRDAYA